VEDSLRICGYRFLQEGLSNAARHAPDAQVKVVVEASAEAISAVVLDDGPGFEPGQRGSRKAEGGQGLAGLRDRAESLGGSLEIASGAEGTKLSLTLPLGKGAEI
jgi:signal transduction histidine kinase